MIKRMMAVMLIVVLAFSITACTLPAGLTDSTTQPGKTTDQSTITAETSSTNGTEALRQETSQSAAGKAVKMTLYFPTVDNSALKKEEREVQVANGAIIKAAVEALLKGPVTKGLHNAIPEGTVLNGVNRKDKVAIVDFSKEFAVANDIAGVVERLSVVNTLTGISGIENVRIHIDGKDMIGPSGMPLGDMGPAKLDENGFPLPGGVKTVTLYFGDSNAEKVIAEKRKVEINKGEQMEEIIFRELMKGPVTAGLHATIPKGTKLLSVRTVSGLCMIDLSKEFVDNSPGGTAGESMTLNSVVNSLTELSTVKKVQFLIDGKKREVYTHAIFDKPFVRNESIIGP